MRRAGISLFRLSLNKYPSRLHVISTILYRILQSDSLILLCPIVTNTLLNYTHRMKNTLERIGGISQNFISNLYSEIDRNPELKKTLVGIKSDVLANTPIKPIYKGLQFVDYLIARSLKDYCDPPKLPSSVDKFLERTFRIPQYYGGIREFTGPTLTERVVSPIRKLFPFDKIYGLRDYKVLTHIEDQVVPEILKRVFSFEEMKDTTEEADESLKQLRELIFAAELDWNNKHITMEDLRSIETESVKVMNLKKTIKCNFELTTVLGGEHKGKERHLRQSFDCSIEFTNEDGKWIASNFSFKRFE